MGCSRMMALRSSMWTRPRTPLGIHLVRTRWYAWMEQLHGESQLRTICVMLCCYVVLRECARANMVENIDV